MTYYEAIIEMIENDKLRSNSQPSYCGIEPRWMEQKVDVEKVIPQHPNVWKGFLRIGTGDVGETQDGIHKAGRES